MNVDQIFIKQTAENQSFNLPVLIELLWIRI